MIAVWLEGVTIAAEAVAIVNLALGIRRLNARFVDLDRRLGMLAIAFAHLDSEDSPQGRGEPNGNGISIGQG